MTCTNLKNVFQECTQKQQTHNILLQAVQLWQIWKIFYSQKIMLCAKQYIHIQGKNID